MKFYYIIGFTLLVLTNEVNAQLEHMENFFSEVNKGKRYIDNDEITPKDYFINFALSKKEFRNKEIVDSLVTSAFFFIEFAKANFYQRIIVKISHPGILTKSIKRIIDVDKMKLVAINR
jgi:hypothetical protein